MIDHIPLSAAETAMREITPHVQYDYKAHRTVRYIPLQAALDALRGVAGARDEVLEAADGLAEITEACLRMMEHVLQGTGKFDMAITPDHRLSTTDGWKRLSTYRQKRGKGCENG